MKKLLISVVLGLTMIAGISTTASAEYTRLTPHEAAYVDYMLDQEADVPMPVIDMMNEFTFESDAAAFRVFIKERMTYKDGYNPLKDCRNPDLTNAQYAKQCS